MPKLEIKNLCAGVNNNIILNNFNLTINEGEIHVIMGPNGIGKSTLSKVIMGNNLYNIKSGKIFYNNKFINNLPTNDRANMGIFLGMQSPVEIEGVKNSDFLRTALHEKEGKDFKLMNFIKSVNENLKSLNLEEGFIHRDVNVNFSGGEKKKNEILQMYMLKPSLIILDEIDSGLDIDSLKLIGKMIMNYYDKYKPSILLITHYQRLLDYIKPNFVHIMNNGHIVTSGDLSLIKIIESKGYNYFDENFKLEANAVDEK